MFCQTCFVRLISDLDTCRFEAKGRRLATEAQPAKQTKVLVVEDDVMIRTVLADMLCELGYTVAAEAASIDEALEATRKTDFDLAILDADLKGRSASPIADALVARDIRFVFVAGYGEPRVARLSRPANPEEAIPDGRVKARAARAPWDTVVTSALPRVGTAKRERAQESLRPFAYVRSAPKAS